VAVLGCADHRRDLGGIAYRAVFARDGVETVGDTVTA
jgi:hypothetical protein